jgi:hypothetical protein
VSEYGEPWRTDEHFPWFVCEHGDHEGEDGEGQIAMFKIKRPAHEASRIQANTNAARAVACVITRRSRYCEEVAGELFEAGSGSIVSVSLVSWKRHASKWSRTVGQLEAIRAVTSTAPAAAVTVTLRRTLCFTRTASQQEEGTLCL